MGVGQKRDEEFNWEHNKMRNLDTWVKFNQEDDTNGTFELSPLERGMGITIGNALRRVLLSCIEGVSITQVKIDNVKHEFDEYAGTQEDILDVLCNLKQIVFKLFDGEPTREITLDVSGEKEVKASDLKLPTDVEIINPDQHIVSITSKGVSFKLTMVIERNIGFRNSVKQDKEDKDISTIYLDSAFSPVLRVNHSVEETRVGQELNYDKLMIDFRTNGSVAVEDSIKQASSILMEQLSLFGELNRRPVFEDVNPNSDEDDAEGESENKLDNLSVDDLELSARSLNCLKKAKIDTVGELIKRDINDLYNIKNFGKKSADEINAKLSEYDLALNNGI
jgi:DNA-directed RNA polymerase subunit alpha